MIHLDRSPHLTIVTALPSEARPLIDFYKCRKNETHTSFQVFTNNDQTLKIIVSGIGQLKAAAATAYCYGIKSLEHGCFLNIGIAGSSHLSLGDSVIANKITDATSQRSFYPWISKKLIVKQASLVTYDKPQHDYQNHPLIDMEAYGFFASALHFVTKEQIQVLKIISDNSAETLGQVNSSSVTGLVESQLPTINKVVKELLHLSSQQAQQYVAHPSLNEIKTRWHFSQYQHHQLKELLRRWAVIYPKDDPIAACAVEQQSKSVLQRLQSQLINARY